GGARQWLLAGGGRGQLDLLRPAAIRAFLGRGGAAERSILLASARTPAQPAPDVRGAPLADGAGVGLRSGNRSARAAADGQRPVRPLSAAADYFGASGRRASRKPVAGRSPHPEIAARHPGQK